MNTKRKLVNIFCSQDNDLFIIPTHESERFGYVEAGEVLKIENNDYADKLYESLLHAMTQCNSIVMSQLPTKNLLAEHLGIVSYGKAVINKKLIILEWNAKNGYSLTPTNKIKGQGYVLNGKQRIVLGKDLRPDHLIDCLLETINVSTIF